MNGRYFLLTVGPWHLADRSSDSVEELLGRVSASFGPSCQCFVREARLADDVKFGIYAKWPNGFRALVGRVVENFLTGAAKGGVR